MNGVLLGNEFNDEVICKDLDPDCSSRKIFCNHEAYRAVMILKCAKTCNSCDEVNKMIEEMEIEEEENESKHLPWTHGGGSTEKEVDENTDEESNNNNNNNKSGGEEVEESTKEVVEESSESTNEPNSTNIDNNVEEEEIEEEAKKVDEDEEEGMPEQSIEDIKNLELEPEDEEEAFEVPVNTIKPIPSSQFNKFKPLSERILSKQLKPQTTTKAPKPKSKTANALLKRIENEKKMRCVDDASDCAARKNLCKDNKFGSIVKKICKRTCGVCQPVTIPSDIFKPLAAKSKNKVKGSDFYSRWKESRNTTPKPVIITMQHMKNQTRNRNKNTFERKAITKNVNTQLGPRNRNTYENILSSRYGNRKGIDDKIDMIDSTPTLTDKANDCFAKQALCNNKGYKSLMEAMCPKTCAAFSHYSYNK